MDVVTVARGGSDGSNLLDLHLRRRRIALACIATADGDGSGVRRRTSRI